MTLLWDRNPFLKWLLFISFYFFVLCVFQVRVIADKETSKPRGYAFIEFVHTRDMKGMPQFNLFFSLIRGFSCILGLRPFVLLMWYASLYFSKTSYMHYIAAYKQADGRKIDGRRVLVDVERGRTVPNWRPRRLGGGLGTTRVGGEDVNQRYSGR